jgi:hypothetical protein
LPIEDLEIMVAALADDKSLQGMRNKALLQIAYFDA